MNAYIIDFYSDSDSPYTMNYIFADSVQEVFERLKKDNKTDVLCIKEINLFQEPETITKPELGIYYFELLPSIRFKFPQKTITVLAETMDLAFSIMISILDEDSRLLAFSQGEWGLTHYLSTT